MRKKNYDILDLYESYIVENYLIGKKNIRDIRNTIKKYGYDLFFKPIEKITEKNIKSCLESTDLIGKKKESKKLTVYLYILLATFICYPLVNKKSAGIPQTLQVSIML